MIDLCGWNARRKGHDDRDNVADALPDRRITASAPLCRPRGSMPAIMRAVESSTLTVPIGEAAAETRHAAQRKPMAAGRGVSGLAGRAPGGWSWL
jgi:hypothetical protein